MLKYQISLNFVEWQPSCSMRAYGQTETKKLIAAFRNTPNVPKNYTLFVCFWRNSPQWARASSFMRFLDHTQ